MTCIDSIRRLLLISNSTLHGSAYLDHTGKENRSFVDGGSRVVFVPYALHDPRAYATKPQDRFRDMGLSLVSIHDVSNMTRAVEEADVIFVGGGNTFRLLKELHDHDLLGPIRRRVAAGVPYMASSAGSLVACPTLKTTKDMFVVQSPSSFEALDLVPFQISRHYQDPDPLSTHMGETQEERIMRFLEENEQAVVGLREGSILRVQERAVVLGGPITARIFRRGEKPIEATACSDIRPLVAKNVSPVGHAA
jgi:dipeptidase E